VVHNTALNSSDNLHIDTSTHLSGSTSDVCFLSDMVSAQAPMTVAPSYRQVIAMLGLHLTVHRTIGLSYDQDFTT